MSDLALSPFVLGGNTFGWTSDVRESFAVLDAFVDGGGVSIDTADVYTEFLPGNSGGDSERIIGDWFASRKNRDQVQIATKVGLLTSRKGLSAGNIRRAVEDSLTRLRTDYLDLYYAHWDDPGVEQAEYLGALDALVTKGKVRQLGASNFTPDRLRSAHSVAAENGLTFFAVSQDHYNLVERAAEQELLPTLQSLGIVEVPYFSLASGFLTGKYRPGQRVDSSRAEGVKRYLEDPRNVRLLKLLDEIAQAHEASVSAVSLAWLRQQPGVGAPLASARTVEQIASLFASAALELAASDLEALSGVQ